MPSLCMICTVLVNFVFHTVTDNYVIINDLTVVCFVLSVYYKNDTLYGVLT